MTLLIADDSEQKIAVLRHMLKKANWTGDVVIAQTTEEAMKLIDAQPIDCAFVDYYMPSQDGPAVIAYLKNKNPAARIALVSSSDKQSNCDEAKAAGAETCICTTYGADEVERTIVELLKDWKK